MIFVAVVVVVVVVLMLKEGEEAYPLKSYQIVEINEHLGNLMMLFFRHLLVVVLGL